MFESAPTLCCVACKEGESLEDFDHVLDVVGCGYQLVVNFPRCDSVSAVYGHHTREAIKDVDEGYSH